MNTEKSVHVRPWLVPCWRAQKPPAVQPPMAWLPVAPRQRITCCGCWRWDFATLVEFTKTSIVFFHQKISIFSRMKSWSKPSKPWHLIFEWSFYGFSHLFNIFQHISRCFTAQRAQGRATSPCRCTWQICPRPRGCGASAPSCWANARGRSRRRSGHWGRPCGRSSAPKLGGFLMVRERVYQSVYLSVYLSIYLSG